MNHFLNYLALVGLLAACVVAGDTTLYNPAIPGWHSDPSCVFVAEKDNTTFCTASTFLLTPGLPILSSKDLVNWKLASHAVTRQSQLPDYAQSIAQSDGIWAATLRYHKGVFYIITIYNNNILGTKIGLIFNSTDPYSNTAWQGPIRYDAKSIDPDIFWDDDGMTYVATAGVNIQTVDLATGTFGDSRHVWNGTTGIFLEGPHLYKKDGYYYLLVAEGGSGPNHTVTMARSQYIWGPYESNPANPVLTNRGTEEYFQNVGHADLFQDAKGRWWSSALAWRSGPEVVNYPMGREMVVTSVSWADGEWPTFSPVRGEVNGWTPATGKDVPGHGVFVTDDDDINFEPNTTLPPHFGFWRWPNITSYTISPPGHPSTLQLIPSFGSITDGAVNYTAGYDLVDRTLIARRQMHTLFEYSVDVSFSPKILGEEVGVTVYLNQVQNLNLGIVMLPSKETSGSGTKTVNSTLSPHFRFIVSGLGSFDTAHLPVPVVKRVPHSWVGQPMRLTIRANNATHYTFSAALSSFAELTDMKLGVAPATIVSGGVGPFTGSLLGTYATANRGTGTTPAYISRWRYRGLGQQVANGVVIKPRVSHTMSRLSETPSDAE